MPKSILRTWENTVAAEAVGLFRVGDKRGEYARDRSCDAAMETSGSVVCVHQQRRSQKKVIEANFGNPPQLRALTSAGTMKSLG